MRGVRTRFCGGGSHRVTETSDKTPPWHQCDTVTVRNAGVALAFAIIELVPLILAFQCVSHGYCGKNAMRVRKTSGIRWFVGKRARAPRCIYRLFVLLRMYKCHMMHGRND